MLPQAILTELFDVRRAVNDIILQQIGDELETYRLVVTNVVNHDHAIVFKFQNHGILSGELRANRIMRQFELHMRAGEYTIFPVFGDWDEIIAALTTLVELV